MNLKNLFSELESKDFYKKFKSEKDSFLTAVFSILDFETNNNKHTFDFFIPGENKIASFEYPFNELKIHEDKIQGLSELKNIDFDLNNLNEKINEIKKEKKTNHKTTKIISILKNNELSLTCLGNSLDILKIKLDPKTFECLNFENSNLLNFIVKK